MKRELMDILVCPLCKGELHLEISQEADGEIISGVLNCDSCPEEYPIENAIPNLLPRDLRTPK